MILCIYRESLRYRGIKLIGVNPIGMVFGMAIGTGLDTDAKKKGKRFDKGEANYKKPVDFGITLVFIV